MTHGNHDMATINECDCYLHRMWDTHKRAELTDADLYGADPPRTGETYEQWCERKGLALGKED